LRLRSSNILVPSFVPTAVPILVLIGGRGYIVDLTVCLLRRVILPLPWWVPLTLLLLLLGCVSSVQPSVTAFIGLAVFLHHRRLVHDVITLRHPPIPAPSRVEVLRTTHHMHFLETTFIKQG
jgi:hypothetical protein